MPIQIRCTCQQILTVDEAHQGQVVGCPYCGTQLTVPVMQQMQPQMQQPPPSYAPQPSGFPPQPQGFPQPVPSPQGFPPPGYAPQGFPPQPVPGPAGWQPPQPPSAPPGVSNNPFADGPSRGDAGNPFSGPSSLSGDSGNPFAAPQAPSFPAPNVPSFPSAPAPSFPGVPTPSYTTPTASAPKSNAPNMPFLAMDTPASRGPSITDLAPKPPGDWEESAPAEQRIWHIPCPNGHVLETPEDMLNQEVLCPFCETQFLLEFSQSIEEKERRERERAIRDEKAGNLWLKWAIGFAIVIFLGLGLMIAIR